MRRIVLTTSAVAAAICLAGCGKKEPVPETPNILTDKRDGQTYKTVVIGGKRWMAENLNYLTDSSWCYNDDTSYCKKYGRLYSWNAAKTACPAGYHLPSREEWDSLVKAVGSNDVAGKMLKSKNGWNDYEDESGNGTDDYGFSALPGGYRGSDGRFGDAGNYGYWWTATEFISGFAYYRPMDYYNDYVDENNYVVGFGFSVRCVADTP